MFVFFDPASGIGTSILKGFGMNNPQVLTCLLYTSTGRREKDGLIIEVEDNGRGMPPELLDILNQKDYHRENHFGIENARKRLRLYYGEAAALHFESSLNKYTKVTLFIPILEGQIIENCDS